MVKCAGLAPAHRSASGFAWKYLIKYHDFPDFTSPRYSREGCACREDSVPAGSVAAGVKILGLQKQRLRDLKAVVLELPQPL